MWVGGLIGFCSRTWSQLHPVCLGLNTKTGGRDPTYVHRRSVVDPTSLPSFFKHGVQVVPRTTAAVSKATLNIDGFRFLYCSFILHIVNWWKINYEHFLTLKHVFTPAYSILHSSVCAGLLFPNPLKKCCALCPVNGGRGIKKRVV